MLTFVLDNSYFKLVNCYIFWLCWVFVAVQTFPSCGKWGLPSSVVYGLLIAVVSLVVECRL